MSINLGKESIALDLKNEDDRAILHDLLATADVLVENYRPGIMEKLGLGWEQLHPQYPRLIYAAASGFGHSGPYSNRAAYDMVVQGMGGLMSVTGHPGSPPTRVGTSIGDITAGLFTAIGISCALFDRSRTGKGMKIDIAMLDCQIAILENAIARLFTSGQVPGPLGARHPSIAPFEAFKAKDGYFIIAAGNDALFAKLCEAVGRADLASNPLFLTNAKRTDHAAALRDELEQVLAAKTVDEWLGILDRAGVPSGPINNVKQVLEDPQVAARNMVVSVDDKDVGIFPMAGNPIKLSGYSDPPTRVQVPDLDGDRAAILKRIR